jgi:hypothetical protein
MRHFPPHDLFPSDGSSSRYRDDYLNYVNALAGMMMCAGEFEDDPKAVARCENRKCVLKGTAISAPVKH